MGHVTVGRRWERVAMDLLDMSITSAKGNRYCDGGLFLSVDGGLSFTGQDRHRWRMLSSVTLYADLGCLV